MHGYAIQCIENLEFACCWFFDLVVMLFFGCVCLFLSLLL